MIIKMQEKNDKDILFSKMVKAGKRVYYIDVKRDRRDEYYLSITESKRINAGGETEKPVFEKHKIFLYREDLNKFFHAFREAADYALEASGDAPVGSPLPVPEEPHADEAVAGTGKVEIDIEF